MTEIALMMKRVRRCNWITFRCTTAQIPPGQAHMNIMPNNLFLQIYFFLQCTAKAGNGQVLFIKWLLITLSLVSVMSTPALCLQKITGVTVVFVDILFTKLSWLWVLLLDNNCWRIITLITSKHTSPIDLTVRISIMTDYNQSSPFNLLK